MVVRNELGRYLEQCLRHLETFVDCIHIIDDRSDDGTLGWLLEYRDCSTETEVVVSSRVDGVPSFAQDEAAFRRWAWDRMVDITAPTPNVDWIITIDADELIVPTFELRSQLDEWHSPWGDTFYASLLRSPTWQLHVLEVFDVTADGAYMVRTDGAWRSIWVRRIALYRGRHPEGDDFVRPPGRKRKEVPSDSLPWRYGDGERLTSWEILHLGYASATDRRAKHQRYSRDGRHTQQHVASIVRRGRLEPWQGRLP